MERYQKRYLLAWGIAVTVFIGTALLVPQQIGEWNKKEGAFWAAFVMVLVLFVGQLICSFFMFRKGTTEQQFLRIPIIYVSYMSLIIMLIVETVCVVIPVTKNWLGFILGLIILACYGIVVLNSQTASEMIQRTGQKVQEETLFVSTLRIEAELLQKQVSAQIISAEVRRVSEAIRYSDPRSNQTLEELEGRLYVAFSGFSEAARAEDEASCKEKAEIFLQLLEQRNSKCKLLKERCK